MGVAVGDRPAAGRSSECHSDMMGGTIVHQRDLGQTVREHLAVQFQAGNAAANPGMIFNGHYVPSRLVAKRYFEISPRSRYAGIEPQCGVLHGEP